MSPLRLPSPRTPDPMDAPGLRWGVLGPGGIATSFADALVHGTRQRVVAVGSRDLARAQAFADRFGADTAYGSYAELVCDPRVDVVYVASPHSEHLAHALLALRAGKHVLVEKAFARNAYEAEQLLSEARRRGLFAMEAMWTRFLPHVDVVRQAAQSGMLGELQTVIADHGQRLYPNGPERLSSRQLAGGALLDLGVYPVSFAVMLLGPPVSVAAVGTMTAEGVDAQDGIVLRSSSGAQALLGCTMTAKTPTTASVSGTQARLEVDGDFYQPRPVRLLAPDGSVLDTYEPPAADAGRGLRFEAAEVARCITAGATESEWLPARETVQILRLLDEVRRQVGVRYPGE